MNHRQWTIKKVRTNDTGKDRIFLPLRRFPDVANVTQNPDLHDTKYPRSALAIVEAPSTLDISCYAVWTDFVPKMSRPGVPTAAAYESVPLSVKILFTESWQRLCLCRAVKHKLLSLTLPPYVKRLYRTRAEIVAKPYTSTPPIKALTLIKTYDTQAALPILSVR